MTDLSAVRAPFSLESSRTLVAMCDSPGVRNRSSEMEALAKESPGNKGLAVLGLVSVQLVFSTYAILGKELLDGGLRQRPPSHFHRCCVHVVRLI